MLSVLFIWRGSIDNNMIFFRTKRIQLQFEVAFLPIPNIQCSMARFTPDNEEAFMYPTDMNIVVLCIDISKEQLD